jgi:hypothetical protein
MKPLHEELKELRLKKGVTLEDIYAVTKIRPALLEKLEEGDFSIAPEPFIRAFLREYAESTGIDPDRVIARYEKKTTVLLEDSQIVIKEPGIILKAPESQKNVAVPEKKDESGKKPLEKTITPEVKLIIPVEAPPEIEKESETPVTVSVEPPAPPTPLKVSFIDDDKPERPVPDLKETVHEHSKSGIEIEEPRSTQGLLFGIFIIIIIIAAIIIIYINGGVH